MLSRAGEEVLIKKVAKSIPIYTMGVFELPMSLMLCVLGFGGVNMEMKRRFTGRAEIHWFCQRRKARWDSGI